MGSHRLRHTVACEMVSAGVPLAQIAQVLRHHSLQTTAAYARVDLDRLRLVAAPWPGGAQAMSELSGHVQDYLRLRRALGFKLERAGHLLPQLVAYLEAAGAATVTSELAIAWARLPAHTHAQPLGQRLAIAAGSPATCGRSTRRRRSRRSACFPTRRHRPTPLPVVAARHLSSAAEHPKRCAQLLRAATYEALFGLLARCGMRVGEAVGLDRDDVDLRAGVITIRHAKFDRPGWCRCTRRSPKPCRATPPSATASARGPARGAFFVSSAGTRLDRSGVGKTLRKITTSLGMRTEHRPPAGT